MGIARANLALAIMKGFRDALGNALSLMAGSVIGVIGYVICYWLGGYRGALVGFGGGAGADRYPGDAVADQARPSAASGAAAALARRFGSTVGEVYPDGVDYLRHVAHRPDDDA